MNGKINYFIINPTAGLGGGKKDLAEKITSACDRRGEKYVIHFTDSHGDATRYVKSVCESNPDEKLRFYSCGGDGTINEMVNGMIGFENAEAAAIPAGTGNDFIKSFSNLENFSDIDCQLDGTAMKTDLIRFGDKYCVNLLNIGFDCNVVYKMKSIRSKINVSNGIAYPLGVVSAFFGRFGQKFSVTIDGKEKIEKTFLLSAFGNGRIYGGGYNAAPLAYIDDGLLDLCLIGKISRIRFFSLIGEYKKGRHIVREKPLEFVTYRKCRHVLFESETPLGVCFDGEVEKYTHLEIEAVREVLPFAVPRGSGCVCSSHNEDSPVPESIKA